MRMSDLLVLLCACGFVLFFIFPQTREMYEAAYHTSPLILSFIKFGLLATGGEILAARLNSGTYRVPQFGVIPKMVIWGFLGVSIYFAFVIFSRGVPALIPGLSQNPAFLNRCLLAFLISVFMNLIFAPPMMLVHHLTDGFIARNGGRFAWSKLNMVELLNNINWERMWGFVYKKTIPLFWIPAHTVTFLLPVEYRTLFAAVLSVILGVFLGLANRRTVAPL